MGKILSVIRAKSSLECLPCDRVNLDYGNFGDYQDAGEHPAERPFEHPTGPAGERRIAEVPAGIPSILRFFLDGSRRTYKIADLILDGRRYLPIVAGQIGVAVLERSDDGRRVHPLRRFCRFVNAIAFPDSIGGEELGELQNEVNRQVRVPFKLLRYQAKSDDPSRDPTDLGVARIMSEMHDIEIQAVREMEEEQFLNDPCGILVIDGPLRFKKRFDLVQFRNVLGLSKTFRPTFTVGKGARRTDVGSITSALRFAERTSVYKTIDEDKVIGVWYLRIRDRSMMTNPLEGIVKVERYAIDSSDQEEGFESDRIDTISRHILRERNVSPYQSDSRWASHIYPVFLAETYLKSSFISDMQFKAFF
jgi:hypothetical protein